MTQANKILIQKKLCQSRYQQNPFWSRPKFPNSTRYQCKKGCQCTRMLIRQVQMKMMDNVLELNTQKQPSTNGNLFNGYNQCCGSGMICSGSGSSSEFSEFRIGIQAKVLHPCGSGSNPCYLSIFGKCICLSNICHFIFHNAVLQYTKSRIHREIIFLVPAKRTL